MFKIILIFTYLISSIAIGNTPKEKISVKEQKRVFYTLWHEQKRSFISDTTKYLKRLLSKHEKGQIIGLELVIAAPTDATGSQWGHSMLRFVDNVGNNADDIVVGFVADVDAMKLNTFKGMGMFGGYATSPDIQSFRHFIQNYIKNQDRPLERYIIPSNPLIISRLVTNLKNNWEELLKKDEENFKENQLKAEQELERLLKRKKYSDLDVEEVLSEEDELIGFVLSKGEESKRTITVKYDGAKTKSLRKYTFLKNNCSGALYRYLENAGIISKHHMDFNARIPIKMNKSLIENGLIYFPKTRIPGILDLKKKLATLLGIDYSKLYDFDLWPKDAGELIGRTFSTNDIIIILDTFVFMPENLALVLQKLLPDSQHRPSYDELYEVITIPTIMYGLCSEQLCIKNQKEMAAKIWEESSLAQFKWKPNLTIEFGVDIRNYYNLFFSVEEK